MTVNTSAKCSETTILEKDFDAPKSDEILAEDGLFWVIIDKYPVSPGHALIVAKSGKSRMTELTPAEAASLMQWVRWTMDYLNRTLSPKPDGFNLGLNDGPAAGQTRRTLHFHVIPRYQGDCVDPRGGVRNVLPAKARYWQKP
jgi:diadenosine tetraphosphate (Ap4A) HIT family hydrolase